MPLPRRMAKLNKHVANPFMLRLAGWAPGFAIVHHVGRRTGREYRTPVNVFRHGDTYLFALTYGEGSWVKNVIAAGGCTIQAGRQVVELTDPRLYRDPERQGVPAPVRWILSFIDADEFLSLRAS